MNNLTITASGGMKNQGVYNFSSSPTIYSSRITGNTESVYNNKSTPKIANTMLNGTVSAGSICIGSYKADFTAFIYPETCQDQQQ